MEQQKVIQTAPMTKKPAYEPPKATFVPINLKERTWMCVTATWDGCPTITGN